MAPYQLREVQFLCVELGECDATGSEMAAARDSLVILRASLERCGVVPKQKVRWRRDGPVDDFGDVDSNEEGEDEDAEDEQEVGAEEYVNINHDGAEEDRVSQPSPKSREIAQCSALSTETCPRIRVCAKAWGGYIHPPTARLHSQMGPSISV